MNWIHSWGLQTQLQKKIRLQVPLLQASIQSAWMPKKNIIKLAIFAFFWNNLYILILVFFENVSSFFFFYYFFICCVLFLAYCDVADDTKFMCNDGSCIFSVYVCNLFDDCPEGEDELTCTSTSLPTLVPTSLPTSAPTSLPTSVPTSLPTSVPTSLPSSTLTSLPTSTPTSLPNSVSESLPTSVPVAGKQGSRKTIVWRNIYRSFSFVCISMQFIIFVFFSKCFFVALLSSSPKHICMLVIFIFIIFVDS